MVHKKGMVESSNDLVTTVLDASGVAVWDCDIRTGRIRWAGNDTIKLLLESRAEQPVTIEILESLLHPDDIEEARRKIKEALNERIKFVLEFRIFGLSNEEVRWLSVIGRGIYNERGVPVRMTGAVAEVTGRRRSEDTLREREKIYASIMSQAEVGIILVDPGTLEFLEFNDAICRMLGYTREEFARLKLSEIQTMSIEQLKKKLSLLLERRGLVFENVHRAKDGSAREARVSVQVLKSGERNLLAAIVADMTEARQREDVLREKAMFLREVEKIARIGGWKANPVTGYLKWTEGIYDIMEASPDSAPDFMAGGKYILPQYIDELVESIRSSFQTGDPFIMEWEILTESGRRLWTEARGVASLREGEDAFAIGTFQDITERKRIEQKLIEYQERLRSLSAELARVQNRERRELAASLHDNVVQSLGKL